MTVVRESRRNFDLPVEILFARLQNVLNKRQKGYLYTGTSISSDQRTICAIIKPTSFPFMLSTKLKIVIEGSASGCSVIVSTRSQRLIFGDIFNFYDRYINDLIQSLETELN